MVYRLDHYYFLNHAKSCIILESGFAENDMIEITSAIAFLLEELVDDSVCLDNECLKKILCSFYGMKDVKADYLKFMPQMRLKKNDWDMVNYFSFNGSRNVSVTQIDLYEAREFCCGDSYKKIMEKWLPKDEKLEELKELLLKEGAEH